MSMTLGRPARPARAGGRTAWRPSLGAWPDGAGPRFRGWAPEAGGGGGGGGRAGGGARIRPLERAADGTFGGLVEGVNAGDRYRYRVDGAGPYPDPVSRYQPEGVHGPSEVVDPARYAWGDEGWEGVAPEDLVVYELHVGTF